MKNESELDKEFEELLKTIGDEMNKKAEQAAALLDEVADMSDKYGVPFKYRALHTEKTYVPSSFKRKFSKVDIKKIKELTSIIAVDLHGKNNDEDVWLTSSMKC